MPAPREASLRFHGALDGLLPTERRGRDLVARFHEGDSIKNLLESWGVPHTEVGLLTIDGEPGGLERPARPGDRIDVYPPSPAAGAGPNAPRFLLDVHLGKLARDLRALGFDAAWGPPFEDAALAARSAAEDRVLVTRDRALLMRRAVERGCLMRVGSAGEQLEQLMDRYGLVPLVRPFGRCIGCNAALVDLAADEARLEVPPMVAERYHAFRRCPACRKVYWPGTHWESMRGRLGRWLGGAGTPAPDR